MAASASRTSKDADPDFLKPPGPLPSVEPTRRNAVRFLLFLVLACLAAEIGYLTYYLSQAGSSEAAAPSPPTLPTSPSVGPIAERRELALVESLVRAELAALRFQEGRNLSVERFALEGAPLGSGWTFRLIPTDAAPPPDWVSLTARWRERTELLSRMGEGPRWDVMADAEGFMLGIGYGNQPTVPLLKVTQHLSEAALARPTSHPEVPPSIHGSPTVDPMNEGVPVAILIDDLGTPDCVPMVQALLDGGWELAFSVIPGTDYSHAMAQRVHEMGRILLLHQPMEPYRYPAIHPGPNTLTLAMTRDQTHRELETALETIPYVVGINNHTGSHYTEMAPNLQWVMEVLLRRNLFFIDSRTSAKTIAVRIARKNRVPAAERDVFLDDQHTPEAIAWEWKRFLERARKKGKGLAIGRPHPETVEMLQTELPRLDARGYRLVALTAMLK